MSEFNFLNINSRDIYEAILSAVETAINEPLYGGDERRIFIDALTLVLSQLYADVNDAARQKMLRYARGVVLDMLGERSDTLRLQPQPAHTVLRFTLNEPKASGTAIPAGTRVTADGTIYFATDGLLVIPVNQLTGDIAATCETPGNAINALSPGNIQTMVDLIPGVVGVTNIAETSGGDDGEPYDETGDTHYRERIRLAANRFSTAGPEQAYRYWALTADPDVVDVAIISPAPAEVHIFPLMVGGALPDQEVLDKVLAVCNADDVRPLTDLVQALAPETIEYQINIHYYTTAADEQTVMENIEGADGAIARYVAWQGGALGRAINPDQLRRYILSPDGAAIPTGALRVDVTAPVFAIVDETQVARLLEPITVTHEVVVG